MKSGEAEARRRMPLGWHGMPRRLLKMRNDDAIEPDPVLTMLMGDVVEPRRNFIESKR